MSEEILGKVEAVGENQEGSFSAIFGEEQTLKVSREEHSSKTFGEEQTLKMEISHQQVLLFLFVLLDEFCDCRAASNIIKLSQMMLTNCPKYSQYMPYCPNF